MRLSLKPHPDTPSPAVRAIVVDVARTGPRSLSLRYELSGDLAALRVPPSAAPERTDELWRHSCFEAFVAGAESGYCEFNLAPSTQWAAYRFSSYREGMAPAQVAPPRIEVEQAAERLVLRAELEAPEGGGWRLGLSAVVEGADGTVSYWALAHPPGRPDFHSPDCFAVELPAPQAT